MMAISKEMHFSRGMCSVTSPEVVVRFSSVIVTASVALAGLTALVADRLGQLLSFLLQQLFQYFFHAATD